MKINILGTEYTVIRARDPEDARFTAELDGFCDETTREIFADDFTGTAKEPNCKKNLAKQAQKVLRHEIIHAFLFESGLAESSEWAQNEEMIDWFAAQMPKILAAWQAADAI